MYIHLGSPFLFILQIFKQPIPATELYPDYKTIIIH